MHRCARRQDEDGFTYALNLAGPDRECVLLCDATRNSFLDRRSLRVHSPNVSRYTCISYSLPPLPDISRNLRC